MVGPRLSIVIVVGCVMMCGAAYALQNTDRPADYVPREVVSQGGAADFVLLEDILPWDHARNEDALKALGYSYAVVRSTDFGAYDLTETKVIVVASDQPDSFYQRLEAQAGKLEAFVAGGGVLVAHLCCEGWATGNWNDDPFLPGAPATQWAYGPTQFVTPVTPAHPVLARISDAELDNWNYTTLGWFIGLPPGVTNVVGYEGDPNGRPCYVEYLHGYGLVLATMMAPDWYGGSNVGARFRMQQDELSYALSQATVHGARLLWAGVAGFEQDGVDPDEGNPDSTPFTLKVQYLHSEGTPPTRANCIVQRREGGAWQWYKAMGMTLESGTPETGAIYSCSRQLPNGIYRYRFRFATADGDVPGRPAHFNDGPLIVGRPFLRWTGEAGFEGDGVDPDAGYRRSTYGFAVLYSDSRGDTPTVAQLIIRRNGVLLGAWKMTPDTAGDDRLGRAYRTQVYLPRPGYYRYRFRFFDASGMAAGEPSRWHTGPRVTIEPPSLALSSLAAVPTAAGAQITFTLASPAQVEAHLLNLAGRPVGTLCRGRPCEAGANTLLWNGRSDTGVRVPGGTYLVEVTARTDDGAQSRALAQVRLDR